MCMYRYLDSDASIGLLDCGYCIHFLYIQGHNQAWPHISSYEFYECYMGYIPPALTNQISVFVTAMI